MTHRVKARCVHSTATASQEKNPVKVHTVHPAARLQMWQDLQGLVFISTNNWLMRCPELSFDWFDDHVAETLVWTSKAVCLITNFCLDRCSMWLQTLMT